MKKDGINLFTIFPNTQYLLHAYKKHNLLILIMKFSLFLHSTSSFSGLEVFYSVFIIKVARRLVFITR